MTKNSFYKYFLPFALALGIILFNVLGVSAAQEETIDPYYAKYGSAYEEALQYATDAGYPLVYQAIFITKWGSGMDIFFYFADQASVNTKNSNGFHYVLYPDDNATGNGHYLRGRLSSSFLLSNLTTDSSCGYWTDSGVTATVISNHDIYDKSGNLVHESYPDFFPLPPVAGTLGEAVAATAPAMKGTLMEVVGLIPLSLNPKKTKSLAISRLLAFSISIVPHNVPQILGVFEVPQNQ